MSVIFTAYTGTFRNIEETESKGDVYEMARIALERMKEDLESATRSEFVGEDAEIDGSSADTLDFVSRAHIVLDEEDEDTGPAKIVYYVKKNDNEEDGSLVFYRSDTPEFEERPEEGTGGLVICDGLSSVDFTYYDDKGDVFDAWDSADKSGEEKLPKMVSIVLGFINKSNPDAPLKFMTSVELPMSMPGEKSGKSS